MNFSNLINSLERFAKILPGVISGVSEESARWRPESGNWSIVEIICHLADEEVEDFRLRTQLTLIDPTQPWPPIDPEGAAITRDYRNQDPDEVIRRFVQERSASVLWLKGLTAPNWDHAYDHPEYGPISAGQLIASWAAHDHLHLRQIAKRLFEINLRDAAPYNTRYAGEWTA